MDPKTSRRRGGTPHRDSVGRPPDEIDALLIAYLRDVDTFVVDVALPAPRTRLARGTRGPTAR